MRAGLKPRPYTRRRKEQYSQKRTARNGCSTKKKDVRRGAKAPKISSNSSARLKSCPPKEKTVKGAQPGTAVPLSWRQRDSQEWLSHWERSGCATKKKDAGLPDTNRRDSHKPGESPALRTPGTRPANMRNGRGEPRPYTRRRKEQYSQKRTARNGCSTKKKDVRRGAKAPKISSNSSARLKSCPPKEKTVKGAQPGVAVPLEQHGEVNSPLHSAGRQKDSQEWLSHRPRQCGLVLNTTSTQ